jgi:hypothetical protein
MRAFERAHGLGQRTGALAAISQNTDLVLLISAISLGRAETQCRLGWVKKFIRYCLILI